MLGDLLAQIQYSNKEFYIFIDANINLLELNNAKPHYYWNLLFASGLLHGIVKATCIQNASKSIIDHVLFKNIEKDIFSGVLLSDLSHHFFTFICPQSAKNSKRLS